jgi:FkbM family methyltransferase
MSSVIDSIREQLIRVLGEDENTAKYREKTEFDRLSAPLGSSLVLFGAGGLGQIVLAGLRGCDIEPLAFVDNNMALWDKPVGDLQVMSPERAAAAFGSEAIFIITIWRAQGGYKFCDIVKQLKDLGCERVLSFGFIFWKHAEVFLPYYSIELPHKTLNQASSILEAFEIWNDEQSCREFVSQINWRLRLDFDGLGQPVPQDQYFPDDLFTLSEDEIFIDCGAFDGDTLLNFVTRQKAAFEKIVAFEPDHRNLLELMKSISKLAPGIQSKIEVYPFGLGARREKLAFDATGSAGSSINQEGETLIEIAPLDEILGNQKPTYIKMDIEGAELDALNGAAMIIRKFHPILAISVYHSFDHLWKLPLLIRSFYDGYKFFLRAHGQEAWDLVCYAVPPDRLTAEAVRRLLPAQVMGAPCYE